MKQTKSIWWAYTLAILFGAYHLVTGTFANAMADTIMQQQVAIATITNGLLWAIFWILLGHVYKAGE